MTAPLIDCAEPSLSGGGLALGNFTASGSLLVLVGGWTPLIDLLAGLRQLSGGRLALAGEPAEGAVARGQVGLARREARLPPTWSVRDVLAASAELLGDSRRSAIERARQALTDLGLEALARRRLSALRPAEQRAVSIAAATLGAPAVLVLEEPLTGLEATGQAYVDAVIGRVLGARAVLSSIPELPGSPSENALAARSDELLFVSGQRLVARGTYRELVSRARSYRVVVERSVDALMARLAEAGYEVRRMLSADVTTLWLEDARGLGTLPLLRVALAVDAPILELVAVGLAESVVRAREAEA